MKQADIIAAAIGLALCVYIWISSAAFPQDVVMHIGPDFFPRSLAVLMGIACIALLAQALLRRTQEAAATLSLRNSGIQRGIIVLGMALVYVGTMEFLGFLIATVMFMMAMMYMLRLRNFVKMLCFAVGTAIVVNLAFGGLLEIQLPMGLLENIL